MKLLSLFRRPTAPTLSEREITRKVERERARHAYAEAEAKRLRACRLRFTGGEA